MKALSMPRQLAHTGEKHLIKEILPAYIAIRAVKSGRTSANPAIIIALIHWLPLEGDSTRLRSTPVARTAASMSMRVDTGGRSAATSVDHTLVAYTTADSTPRI